MSAGGRGPCCRASRARTPTCCRRRWLSLPLADAAAARSSRPSVAVRKKRVKGVIGADNGWDVIAGEEAEKWNPDGATLKESSTNVRALGGWWVVGGGVAEPRRRMGIRGWNGGKGFWSLRQHC